MRSYILLVYTEFARVMLGDCGLHVCTESQVVTWVRRALDQGSGGRIITPNVDILRQARRDERVRAYLADATLVVADGMPLIWASRLAGTPLPERVCGSSLIWSLSAGLARDGRSVYLLGGEPSVPAPAVRQRRAPDDGVAPDDGARRAARRLAEACPGLRIAGQDSPAYGFDRDPGALAATCRAVIEAKPDLVYVGLGFPKQERLISKLRRELPFTWFLGCGAAINFVAGDITRAPAWMQRTGLEWAHRLVSEPRRLARRYVGHDAPYALRLLLSATTARYRHR